MKLYHGQAVSKHGSTKHNAKLFSIVTLHLDLSVNCNFEPGTFHGRNNNIHYRLRRHKLAWLEKFEIKESRVKNAQ